MASIAFGGGPSNKQRREFSSLIEGSQIPGYQGFTPQIKYRLGGTFGKDTREIFKGLGLRPPTTLNGITSCGVQLTRTQLPKFTYGNKYTEGMVPGYAGYMPGIIFKHGKSFRVKSDVCINDFKTNHALYAAKLDDLQQQTTALTPLTAIDHKPVVGSHVYCEGHPLQQVLLGAKRGLNEAPIPGYDGFVPRMLPTQIGLGQRYKRRTQQCLNAFACEHDKHCSLLTSQPSKMGRRDDIDADKFSRRLYVSDGMIPRYTGYIPQRRYAFGNTYGDTTRSLEVCSRGEPSFGKFAKTQSLPQPLVAC